eukprot:1611251-Alexandrium_andersonii.AAC.1
MSASLVGSEMCIRDSCSCSVRCDEAIVVGGGLAGVSAANTVLENGGKACLLYTSDAADDM